MDLLIGQPILETGLMAIFSIAFGVWHSDVLSLLYTGDLVLMVCLHYFNVFTNNLLLSCEA